MLGEGFKILQKIKWGSEHGIIMVTFGMLAVFKRVSKKLSTDLLLLREPTMDLWIFLYIWVTGMFC